MQTSHQMQTVPGQYMQIVQQHARFVFFFSSNWNELLLQRAEHTIGNNCPQAAPSGSSSKSPSSEQHLVWTRAHYETFCKSVPSTHNQAAWGSHPLPHPTPPTRAFM